MKSIELHTSYYMNMLVCNIVWRVQKLAPISIVELSVGDKGKTYVMLKRNENGNAAIVEHNDDNSTTCMYFNDQCGEIERVDEIEKTARKIVQWLS